MERGGWAAFDRRVESLLRPGARRTRFEALVLLQIQISTYGALKKNKNGNINISYYAQQWGWARKTVRNFLKMLALEDGVRLVIPREIPHPLESFLQRLQTEPPHLEEEVDTAMAEEIPHHNSAYYQRPEEDTPQMESEIFHSNPAFFPPSSGSKSKSTEPEQQLTFRFSPISLEKEENNATTKGRPLYGQAEAWDYLEESRLDAERKKDPEERAALLEAYERDRREFELKFGSR